MKWEKGSLAPDNGTAAPAIMSELTSRRQQRSISLGSDVLHSQKAFDSDSAESLLLICLRISLQKFKKRKKKIYYLKLFNSSGAGRHLILHEGNLNSPSAEAFQ